MAGPNILDKGLIAVKCTRTSKVPIRFDILTANLRFKSILSLFDHLKRSVSDKSVEQSLSGRATRSGVWIGGGFVVQRGLQFVSNLILTRILFPEAFGLMALCTVFIVGLAMFSDLGLKPAIIRDARGADPVFLNTAWTIQVIRGVVLFIGGCLLAFPISIVYGNAILFPLLAVISTTALIAGFTSIKMVTAERDLDFRTVTFVTISGQAAQIVTMVLLAYFWRSVWALAVGGIIGSLTMLLIGHVLLRGHQHRLQIDSSSARSLVHFGKWIFFSTIVTFLGGEGLRAIQAGFITPAEFGILAIAYSIAAIPFDLSFKLTASIGLPALAEAYRNNPNEFLKTLHNFRSRLLIVSLGLVSAVALTSETLVSLLYDSRYHAAGSLIVAITLANATISISTGYDNALLVVGKSKAYLCMISISTVGRVIGTIIGLKIYGILGMIVGIGISNLVVLSLYWIIMYRVRLVNFKIDLISLIIIAILVFTSVIF